MIIQLEFFFKFYLHPLNLLRSYFTKGSQFRALRFVLYLYTWIKNMCFIWEIKERSTMGRGRPLFLETKVFWNLQIGYLFWEKLRTSSSFYVEHKRYRKINIKSELYGNYCLSLPAPYELKFWRLRKGFFFTAFQELFCYPHVFRNDATCPGFKPDTCRFIQLWGNFPCKRLTRNISFLIKVFSKVKRIVGFRRLFSPCVNLIVIFYVSFSCFSLIY